MRGRDDGDRTRQRGKEREGITFDYSYVSLRQTNLCMVLHPEALWLRTFGSFSTLPCLLHIEFIHCELKMTVFNINYE